MKSMERSCLELVATITSMLCVAITEAHKNTEHPITISELEYMHEQLDTFDRIVTNRIETLKQEEKANG